MRADQLAGFFADLTRVRSADLSHPEAAQDAERQLSGLERSYADVLSESQSALVAKAKEDLRDRIQQSCRSAHDQLSQLEKQLAGWDIGRTD